MTITTLRTRPMPDQITTTAPGRAPLVGLAAVVALAYAAIFGVVLVRAL